MSRTFETRLAAFRRRWQCGLLLLGALRLAGLLLAAYAVYALADFFLALENNTRWTLNILLGAALAAAILWGLARAARYSRRAAAAQADRLSGNKRRAILSACELLAARKAGAPLSDYLLEQSVARAGAELDKIPASRCFPKAAFASRSKRLAIQAAVLLAAVAVQKPGAGIVLERLLHPTRDVPPFSGLVFHITPETPRIPYGGGATVGVEITGGRVKSQVWFVTRSGGVERRIACFQEGPARFAQKVEKLVEPVEFAFATGRARSRWHRVDLLLQPRVAQAALTITPPAYTGLPRQSGPAGKAPVTGIAGSTATLTIESNRPLRDGALVIRPPEELGGETLVQAAKTGPRTVAFTWTMAANADLDVTISDLRGTPNGEPFRLVQRVTPDQPPQATITEPGVYALATPDSTLTLAGYAEDDIGLARADLVRTVVGYRDRAKRLGPDAPGRHLEFSTPLDMKTLGVVPGQTLEFYLEATDTNPTLMGIGTSAVVRVEIISTDNYAQMIRDRTTIEEFAGRYNMLTDRLEALRKALDKLQENAYSATEAEKERQLGKAREEARKTRELFQKMGKDFPAFDAEKSLGKTAAEIGEKIAGVEKGLENLSASDPKLGEIARDLRAELGGPERQMDEQKRSAQEIAAVSRVMENVAAFQKIVLQQTELERQMNRAAQSGRSEDKEMLRSLGERQAQIREALQQSAANLGREAAALPRGYEALKETAADFLNKLEAKKIPGEMAGGEDAARNQNAREAAQKAASALEKLRQLLSECKGMGGMCQGQLTFNVPNPLSQTLQQMLQSLLARASGNGSGNGTTGAAGWGAGTGESGGTMGGNSPLNTPVYGPSRLSLTGNGPFGNGAGDPKGGNQPVGRVEETGPMTPSRPDPIKSKGTLLENVPEKYRGAVKQYFSIPEEKP
ncbi:MAG: hypothetical protein PHQ12_03860 [Chthoniobacteraceae bacterium]|nr:hypothetical protein [Chthoniobacteraceae bacterium]